MAIKPGLTGWVLARRVLRILTETCPDRKLGLMGDVMEMDGPTFCESKELEPEERFHCLIGDVCFSVRFKLFWKKTERVPRRTNSLEFS